MRYPRLVVPILVLAGVLAAVPPRAAGQGPDLGNLRPPATRSAPPAPSFAPPPAGGDNVATATPIPSLPFTGMGTTCGALDDYDAACSYAAAAPDLVYAFTATSSLQLDIDLCGSSYDTKLFLLDGVGNVLACNEDYYGPGDPCGVYVSRLLGAPVAAGQTIYLVIDGYGVACGDYILNVTEHTPCSLTCPAALQEDEPALHDGYVDRFNSGCNTPAVTPAVTTLHGDALGMVDFCGNSGFYTTGGLEYRDTDWFAITLGETGEVAWQLDAEYVTWGIVVDLSCPNPPAYALMAGGSCDPGSLTIIGSPGAQVGLWVGPPVFEPPLGMTGHEYRYHMQLSGVSPHRAVAVEAATWGGLKSLYR